MSDIGASYQTVDNLTQALKAAPELQQNPGLAVPAAQTPDPVGTAQTLAYQTQQNGIASGIKRADQSHHGLVSSVLGFFGHTAHTVAHGFETGISDVGKIANKPLQVAQHEYRYLHDVAARHGLLSAIGEGLLIGVAGVGAAVLAPETGGASIAGLVGVLGAEGAAAGLGQVTHQDSWQRTADGTKYLDPNTHQPVSAGRDLAQLLGEKPGSATYKWTSGITDGIADLAVDPLAKAGAITGAVRAARVTAMTGDDVVRLAASSPRVSRAVDAITRMDAGTITARFPKLVEGDVATRTLEDGKQVAVPAETLAHQLGAATTREQVIQILRDRVDGQGISKGLLPNISLSAIPADKVREWAASGSLTARVTGAGAISRGQQLLPEGFDTDTMAITNHDIDPFQGRAGLMVYRWLKGNGQTEAVARQVATNFHNAMTYTDRLRIWRSAMFSAVKAQAVRKGLSADEAAAMSDEEFQRRLAGEFKSITGGEYPGQAGEYGYDHHGNLIPPVVDPAGAVRQAAVMDNQIGKISFPAHSDIRAAAAELAGHRNLYGRADDFMFKRFTSAYFKRWVLSTGSFAAHVSLSEAILNSLRVGLRPILQARLAMSAAKGEIDAATEEALADPEAQKSIAARMWHMMNGKVADSKMAKYAYEIVHSNTFHGVVPPALRAGHSIEWADAPPEEVVVHTVRDGARKAKLVGTDDFSGWTPAENKNGEQVRAWQQTLNQITKDPASAEAAKAYHGALLTGQTADQAHTAGAAAARAWLDAHPELHHLYERAQLPTEGWEHMAPLDAWAHAKMLNVRGATTGATGTVHHDLLKAITDGAGGTAGGPVAVGAFVKAADRANIGKVIGIDERAGTATVHFINKAEGSEARVELPLGQLTTAQIGARQLPDRVTRDYLDAIDDKPAKVLGRIYMPDPTAKLERVANKIHEYLAKPIDFISREPTYLATYAKYRDRLEPLIADGRLSEADAIVRAQTWAAQDMVRFVHNIHEKTQLSEILHNYAPFWFAQQQAYKRVGRLLASNPGAFRKYQLMVTALHDIGTQQTDAGGNNYMSFPGAGFIGAGVPGLLGKIGLPMIGSSPVSFAGSLDSVSYVMPGAAGFRPDVGPVIAIPGKALASLFPELTPLASKVVGNVTMSEPLWKQFVPNSIVQHVADALGANSRSFSSTMMYTIQTLQYEQNRQHEAWVAAGAKGKDPSEDPSKWIVPPADAGPIAQQAFINKVKNQTRILYLVRAGLGLVSPLAPQITVKDFGFPAQLQAAIKKAGSVTGGLDVFLKAHPDATPYTVFQSTDPSGFALPDSKQAEDWINSHMGLIRKYPNAAAWLMPQLTDTKYDAAVYNEQLAQGIRVKRTPQEFLNALYVAAGNTKFYNVDRPAYEAALTSGNYDTTALRSQFAEFTQNFGLQNPVWYDDYQSKDRTVRRQETVAQLRDLISSGQVQGPMVAGVAGLISDWDNFQTAVASGVDTKANLADQFKTYLDGVAADHPELKPFILSVLRPLATGSTLQTSLTTGVAA